MNKIEILKEYQGAIADLQYTINLLGWDLKINSPKDAQKNMVNLMSKYEDKLFELQTKDYYGILLNDAIKSDEFKLLSEQEQRYIIGLFKDYSNYKKIPAEFNSEYEKLKNEANIVWRTAKESNNYDLFKPYLSKMIGMTKQYYRFINPGTDNLYDVMLNNYETGVTSEQIDRLFNNLKRRILPLIHKEKSNVNFINKEFTKEELMSTARYLLDYIGFDNNKGTLGIYPHGYTEKMCANDIRIAFRKATDPTDFVSTIIHEGGHGIFEQNINPVLSGYVNETVEHLYGLHESQSRFYENILGRNKNFWIPIYDDVKKLLNLDISMDEFVNLLNTTSPSLIRTQADELTYCMHIIVRYEIEKDIFSNKITVDDIPALWNQKMKDYLNVEVDCDANGLMQDVHWSEGDFGYFPSYLLGSIYDGMFMEAINKNLGNIDDLLKEGKIKDITKYLTDNIYVNGGAYTSNEIINKMCGEEISSEPIIKYFEKKYK